MRLSLNGWPPLASHLAALIIGGAFVSYAKKSETSSLKIPDQTLIFSLPRDLKTSFANDFQGSNKDPKLKSLKILLGKKEPSSEICLFSYKAWRVLHHQKHISFLGSYDQNKELNDIFSSIHKKTLFWISTDHPQIMHLCAKKPKVIYGS